MPVKFKINETKFDNYTNESAYWAGFLAADGNLRIAKGNIYQVRLYLKKSDSTHLLKFKEFLQADHKVSLSPTYDRCSFEFSNERIYKKLGELYNITANKSLTLKYPEQLPLEFERHFIRGIFDGDGCITEGFWNKNSRTASVSITIVSTEDVINHIFKYAEKILGPITYMPSNHAVTKGVKVFNLCIRQGLQFLEHLYEDSEEPVRLDRKYSIFYRIMTGGRKTREIIPYKDRMPVKSTRKSREDKWKPAKVIFRKDNGIV